MNHLLPIFKAVSMIFAVSAVATGAWGIINPVAFSKQFGLPMESTKLDPISPQDNDDSLKDAATLKHQRDLTMSYISLMSVRQLGTGIILLIFAYQCKWTEAATILAVIGIIVAGTDGIYLARAGPRGPGIFHAIPGALISALAAGVIYLDS